MATDIARLERLRQIALFSKLDDATLERILDIANEVDIPAGQVFVEAHLEGSGMFVIEEGTVTVQAHDHTHDMGAGECVGELALLTPEAVRTARVKAKTDVRCLAISRFDFGKLLESEPKLAIAMLEALAARLVAATT